MNFKQETYEDIQESGHTREDVMFVGSADGEYRATMDHFDTIADFEYDAGYGSQKIADDLIVYFYDGSYMTRSEYDGSEGWAYNSPKNFTPDQPSLPIRTLGGNERLWESLGTMHEERHGATQ